MLAQTLAVIGEHYKSADTLLKLAKVQNWTSGEDYKDKPVFANLTQADIDRLRAEIKKAEEQGQQFDLAKAIVEIKTPKVN